MLPLACFSLIRTRRGRLIFRPAEGQNLPQPAPEAEGPRAKSTKHEDRGLPERTPSPGRGRPTPAAIHGAAAFWRKQEKRGSSRTKGNAHRSARVTVLGAVQMTLKSLNGSVSFRNSAEESGIVSAVITDRKSAAFGPSACSLPAGGEEYACRSE